MVTTEFFYRYYLHELDADEYCSYDDGRLGEEQDEVSDGVDCENPQGV
jgi:hypothetical protein